VFGDLNGDAEFNKTPVKLNVSKTQVEVPDMFLRKTENMFWPCHDKKNPCTPEYFFNSKGCSAEFKAKVDNGFKKFCKANDCNMENFTKNC